MRPVEPLMFQGNSSIAILSLPVDTELCETKKQVIQWAGDAVI